MTSAWEPRRRIGFVVGATIVALLAAGTIGVFVGRSLRSPAGGEDGGLSVPSWNPIPPPAAIAFMAVAVENISVEVPTTWEILEREAITITLRDPESGGLVLLRSGTGEQAFTLDGMQDALVAQLGSASTSAELCTQPTAAPVPAGPTDGRYFAVCSVVTPSGGGPTETVVDGFFIGLEAGGRTIFVMRLTAASGERWALFNENVLKFVAPTWRLMTEEVGTDDERRWAA